MVACALMAQNREISGVGRRCALARGVGAVEPCLEGRIQAARSVVAYGGTRGPGGVVGLDVGFDAEQVGAVWEEDALVSGAVRLEGGAVVGLPLHFPLMMRMRRR